MTLDIYSFYAVGWMVAPQDSAILAERLIRETRVPLRAAVSPRPPLSPRHLRSILS